MKRGYVDTPDGQIHYRIEEKEGYTGIPVVVLHSTPMSSWFMAPLLAELGKEMTAIGMDTIGYGGSDRPPKPYLSMHEFAQAVAWFIEGLGYKQVYLYGEQTGSQIAMQTAADFPELIAGLIVNDPFNWSTPERRAVHEKLHYYHVRKEDGSHLLSLWQRSRHETDLRRRDLSFLHRLTVNDEEGAEVYEGMGWEGAGPYAMGRQDIWEVTPRIQAPTFVMYHPQSQLHRSLERFLDTIPHSRGTREAPNAHRDPAAAARLMVDFYTNPGV